MFRINEDNSMEIIRGDSGIFTIELIDEQGEPYELQPGDTVFFTVKENTKSDDALIQKNTFLVEIEPEDTEELEYGDYVYDIQFVYSTGFIDTIIPPTLFRIKEEVTF